MAFDELKAHVFVCCHHREVGACCSEKGSAELFQNLKDLSRSDPTWRNKVKVSRSGCLGLCSEGIAAVIYPKAHWVTNLKKDSGLDTLKEEISKIL